MKKIFLCVISIYSMHIHAETNDLFDIQRKNVEKSLFLRMISNDEKNIKLEREVKVKDIKISNDGKTIIATTQEESGHKIKDIFGHVFNRFLGYSVVLSLDKSTDDLIVHFS